MFKGIPRGLRPVLLVLTAIALGAILLGCTGTQPMGWSGATISGQVLYIGDPQGYLLARNVENGTPKWEEDRLLEGMSRSSFGCAGLVRPSAAVYGTPSVLDGLVYATSYNGKVYAFNADTGAERWVYPREGALDSIVGGPALGESTLFFGASDGKVYALDAATGDFKWFFTIGAKVWATPAVDGGRVYVGGLDGRMYALDAASGTEVWRSEKLGGIVGAPALNADTLFIGSMDRNLYALDRNTGKEKWRFSGSRWFWASPILKDKLVVAANTDGKVYALDAASGKEVWVSDLHAMTASTPVWVDGKVVAGAEDGKLHVLDENNGNSLRTISAGRSIQGPLAAQGTRVYARTKESDSLYVKGFDVQNGTPVLSAPLQPKLPPTPTTTAGWSRIFSDWRFIIFGGLLLFVIYLLLTRRRAS